MVLGWTNGDNSIITDLKERIAKLESSLEKLLTENTAQKKQIEDLTKKSENSNNRNKCSEWRDMLIGNKKKISEQQMSVLNAVGSEQKDRQKREN